MQFFIQQKPFYYKLKRLTFFVLVNSKAFLPSFTASLLFAFLIYLQPDYLFAQSLGSKISPQFREEIGTLMQEKKFKEAEKQLEERLGDIYTARMENRLVPSDLIQTAIQKAEKIDKQQIVRKKPRVKSELRILDKDEDIFFLHLNLAFAKLNLKKYKAAISNFREAKRYKIIKPEEKKNYAFIDHQIAIAFRAIDQQDAFFQHMEQAIKADPNNQKYLSELGIAYGIPHYERSIQYLEKFLRTQKDDSSIDKSTLETVHLLLSGLYEKKGRFLDTARHYQDYLRSKPEDGRIRYALAYIQDKRLGHHDIALRNYRQSLQQLPKTDYKSRFKIHALAGEIFRKNRQYQDAILQFQQTKPFFAQITKELNQVQSRISSIQQKMDNLKLKIIRANDRKSQEILTAYQANLNEQQKKMQDISAEKLGYNYGKIEWEIARNFELSGDYENSRLYYQKAFNLGYRKTDALLKIQRLSRK